MSNLKDTYKNLSWPFIIFYLALNIYSPLATKASVFLLIIFLAISNINRLEQTVVCAVKSWPLMLLIIWESLSLLWSKIPIVTMGIAINELEIYCFSLLLAQYCYNKATIIPSLKFVSGFLITASVLYSIFFYPIAISSIGLRAFYFQKNYLGEAMVICTFIQIFSPNRRNVNYALAFVGLALILLSESKTSLNLTVAILLLWSTVVLFKKAYSGLSEYSQGFLLLASKLIPVFLYIGMIFLIIFREDVVGYLMQHLNPDDFTGRGQLWITELSRNQNNLLSGIGLGVFWGADRASEVAQTLLYDQQWIHSLTAGDGGYVDMIGAVGFIGLVLLFLVYINNYKLIFNNIDNEIMPLAFALITFTLLHSTFETSFFKFINILWFLFSFFTFYISLASNELKKTNNTNKIY